MKRLIISLGLLLLLAGQGWAAYGPTPGTEDFSFYIKTVNAGAAAPYNTWAKAATSMSTIHDYLFVHKNDDQGGGKTYANSSKCIYMAPGTYTDDAGKINQNDSELHDITFTGALGVNAQDASETVRDTVIINCTSGNLPVFVGGSNPADCTIQNLSIISVDRNINLISGNNYKFYNVKTQISGANTFTTASQTGLLIDRCLVKVGSGKYGLSVLFGVSGIIQRCLFVPINDTYIPIYLTGANNTLTVQASDLFGASGGALVSNGDSAAITVYNCLMNGAITNAPTPIVQSTGDGSALTAIKNYFINSVYNSNTTANGGTDPILVTGAGSTYNGGAWASGAWATLNYGIGDPKLTTWPRMAYFVPWLDDYESLTKKPNGTPAASYSESALYSFETALSSYGWSGTFALNTGALVADSTHFAANTATLQAILGRGTVEICSHTWGHCPAGNLTALATIGYSGGAGANPSYQVDLTNHYFRFKTDTVDVVNVQLDATNKFLVDGTTYATFANVLAYANAHGGNNHWTATYSNGTNPATYKVTADTLILCAADMADFAGVATAVAIDTTSAYTSNTGFYFGELKTAKDYLEGTLFTGLTDPQTGVAYAASDIVYPYGLYDATWATNAIKIGYNSCRGTGSAYSLANQDLTQVYDWATVDNITKVGTLNTATITAVVRNMVVAAMQGGLVVPITYHLNNVSQTTAIFDALKPYADAGLIKVMSMQKVMAEITAAPWTWTHNTTTGVSTTARTYTDVYNYQLKGGSPLINTGSNLSLTTDFPGNKVPNVTGNVSIGAYEYETWGSPMGTGLGLTGANHRPQ